VRGQRRLHCRRRQRNGRQTIGFGLRGVNGQNLGKTWLARNRNAKSPTVGHQPLTNTYPAMTREKIMRKYTKSTARSSKARPGRRPVRAWRTASHRHRHWLTQQTDTIHHAAIVAHGVGQRRSNGANSSKKFELPWPQPTSNRRPPSGRQAPGAEVAGVVSGLVARGCGGATSRNLPAPSPAQQNSRNASPEDD
jgi:hypothetical protein